jgi:hypothetical protein
VTRLVDQWSTADRGYLMAQTPTGSAPEPAVRLIKRALCKVKS